MKKALKLCKLSGGIIRSLSGEFISDNFFKGPDVRISDINLEDYDSHGFTYRKFTSQELADFDGLKVYMLMDLKSEAEAQIHLDYKKSPIIFTNQVNGE